MYWEYFLTTMLKKYQHQVEAFDTGLLQHGKIL
jgi:hypothetical protein